MKNNLLDSSEINEVKAQEMQEIFVRNEGSVTRRVKLGFDETISTVRDRCSDVLASAVDAWDQSILLGEQPVIQAGGGKGKRRVIDLFSGAGGLSYGVTQGLKAAGFSPVVELAADLDPEALRIFERNLAPREVHLGDVSQLVDVKIGRKNSSATFKEQPWIKDRRLASRLAGCDILIGGPPCQGHSNLNNHTRRVDLRNELYLAMPAIAVALDIPVVIIENVREVLADYHRVVDQTKELFLGNGYCLAEGVLSALDLGVPQTRNRYFLIAVKGSSEKAIRPLSELMIADRPKRNLAWAIQDLERKEYAGIHRPATLSEQNQARINFLFENQLWDLPNEKRPKCHQNGTTYRSVYGRLKWEAPSGTITTGYLTPGRGRFIHPSQRRALTPHEAARIQGFPDAFAFEYARGEIPMNKTLAKVIGDAVPPAMGYAAILAAMSLSEEVIASQRVTEKVFAA